MSRILLTQRWRYDPALAWHTAIGTWLHEEARVMLASAARLCKLKRRGPVIPEGKVLIVGQLVVLHVVDHLRKNGVAMSARTIHPFPARMAPDIAINQLEATRKKRPLNVLDPMCGSGTVLAAAAAAAGHIASGFDLDPLAVLMSSVSTRPIDTACVVGDANRVLAAAKESIVAEPMWDDVETIAFAEYWFGDHQRTQLNRLSREIDKVGDRDVRDALRVALSRIIVTKAPRASLAGDTSHSRPHRVLRQSTYDVYSGFTQSVSALATLLDRRSLNGTVTVKHGDARFLDLPRASVDIAITSPPYLNAIDYLRGRKMSLIWFGYTISELRSIRSTSPKLRW